MNTTADTSTGHRTHGVSGRSTNTATGAVQIFGAVLVPSRVTGTVARHAPPPARNETQGSSNEPDENTWVELERVMQARAASMAAHPSARANAQPADNPTGLRLAS